jgi:hypothetical protein
VAAQDLLGPNRSFVSKQINAGAFSRLASGRGARVRARKFLAAPIFPI